MPTAEGPDPDERRIAIQDWADMARADARSLVQRATVACAQSAALRTVFQQARLAHRQATKKPCSVPPSSSSQEVAAYAAQAALGLAALSPTDVWIAYAGLGGERPVAEIVEYLSGRRMLPELESRIVSHAVNELLMDIGLPPLATYATRRRAHLTLTPSGLAPGCRSC